MLRRKFSTEDRTYSSSREKISSSFKDTQKTSRYFSDFSAHALTSKSISKILLSLSIFSFSNLFAAAKTVREMSKNPHSPRKNLYTATSFAAFIATPRSGFCKAWSFSEKIGYFFKFISPNFIFFRVFIFFYF